MGETGWRIKSIYRCSSYVHVSKRLKNAASTSSVAWVGRELYHQHVPIGGIPVDDFWQLMPKLCSLGPPRSHEGKARSQWSDPYQTSWQIEYKTTSRHNTIQYHCTNTTLRTQLKYNVSQWLYNRMPQMRAMVHPGFQPGPLVYFCIHIQSWGPSVCLLCSSSIVWFGDIVVSDRIGNGME